MRVDELERSLREMAAGQEPVTSGRRAVQRRRRNHQAVRVAGAVVVLVALLGGLVAWRASTTASSGLKVATTPGTIIAAGPLARCFDTITNDPTGPDGLAVQRTSSHWPSGTSDLLVTTDGGGVDVIHGGSLTQWAAGYPTHGPNPNRYLWARWGQDGSIYASRLDGRSVVIDRLTSERPATVAVSLPFTVKADAPVGYCPIDGYLAGFSIGPEGVVMIKHDAGPVGHSCPAFPSQAAGETSTTADPWRCASPDGISTELRAEGIAQPGQIDDFYGGSSIAPSDDSTPIAADSTDSGLVVVRTGSDATLERFGASASCCAAVGVGPVAISPDGTHYASVVGRAVRVDFAPSGGPSALTPGSQLWISPDRVEAMAWSGDWLAVAHGHELTLVSTTTSGQVIDVAHLSASVRDLDWSR